MNSMSKHTEFWGRVHPDTFVSSQKITKELFLFLNSL